MTGTRLNPYPETKDSGIEWLGQIPAHWKPSKIYGTCSVKARLGWKGLKADEYVDEGYIFLSTPNIKSGEIDFENVNYITEERYLESPEIMLQAGDVLLAKDGSTLGIVNVVRELPSPATVNSSIAVIRPGSRRLDSMYLCYLLASEFTQSVIERMKGGMGVPHLFQADIRKFRLLEPPLPEQQAIANFLDRETAKIDALVEKKERLIELLQEKRTALITHAVTKGLPAAEAAQAGLDPDVPMKDSGIEWLGQIPEHWETRSVRYQFDNLDHRRIPLSNEDRASLEKVYPYYGASGIIDQVDDFLLDESLVLVAEDGANLLSRSTPLAFLASGKYWVNNHAHILRPRSGDIRYWVAALQTFDYTPLISGAAQPKLTGDRLDNITVPLPPDAEQAAIADHLAHETARIDALIAKVKEAIERLKEYRTALISAAVTGKIDVQGLASEERMEVLSLPEKPE